MITTTVYGQSSKGKIKQWSATSSFDVTPKGIAIIVTWGYYGEQFKKQNKTIYVTSGKNIGKSNETTITEQTILKINQLYEEQLDNGYVVDLNQLTTVTEEVDYAIPKKPQLAHKFKDKKHLIKTDEHGCLTVTYFGQPKLNGTRCFATKVSESQMMFSSRSGKLFKEFTHFSKDLLPILEVGDILDGEIFNVNIPFENIQSLVNSDSLQYTVNDSDGNILYKVEDLQLHLYDCIKVNTNKVFVQRLADLTQFSTLLVSSASIKFVTTTLFKQFYEFAELFSKYVAEGYEGLMLRNSQGLYKFGYRTADLIKYKEMLQDEFLIVDIYLADNDPTKVQILCKNRFEKDSFFDVGSVKGNKLENLKKYYDNRESLINKAFLTVDYQALSEYNVPLFSVGVDLRAGTLVDNVFVPEV